MKDKSFNVLLIEDNPEDARLIQEFLSNTAGASFDTLLAERLSDGIEALSLGKFDVILLDLSLPDSTGLDTLTAVRSQVPETAVIVLTGLNDEETAIEAVRTGAQDYLIKGEFEPVLLSRSIQYAVERKQFESQLRQAHKMEAVGTLTGGIAHDFNNILAIILGNTELAMEFIAEENPARRNLEQVHTACIRAKEVIRQLLSFCRKTEQKRKPADVVLVIRETLKLLRSSISAAIDIRQNMPKHSEKIMAVPAQIHQVLINLCTNSAYAMREKGGVLEVSLGDVILSGDEVGLRDPTSGHYVRLTVSDTGHGIAPETMEKIFDPYFTTKPTGEGTGMGLSLVHSIVKNHGGEIRMSSVPGKGTTVEAFFPVIDADGKITGSVSSEPVPTGNERILLLDDEFPIADVLRCMLEKMGYDVTLMTDSSETLETFRSHPDKFDLVITDMTMPKMTGEVLSRKLMEIRPDIPIIICTGFSEIFTEEKAANIGIRAYLNKPVSMDVLARTVREVLDERKQVS
ncbi:response regulator [Desulfobacterales bacterium HSG2]|nr:response regulator [Desulfobacterales bacterium HSG2]